MSNNRRFSKDTFQDFCTSLVGQTDITYRLRGYVIDEARFIEGMAGNDAELAEKIKAWREAGKAMRQHIESRQDVVAAQPIELCTRV